MSNPKEFHLRTLGAAALFVVDEDEPRLQAGKGFGLLTLLALTPGRRLSRDVLIDMLWSDADPERARNALRQALWSLRRTLGDEAIGGSASELALVLPLSVDRDVFLARVEAGQLDDAIACYTGAFLPSFCVPGGALFEQWADVERRRLETVFVRSAELLVGRLIGEGQARQALTIARMARERAPDNEAARRLMLETAVSASNVMVAMLEAESLAVWARDIGHPLEPSTQRALAAARSLGSSASVPNDRVAADRRLVAELVGRETEFAQLVQAWERVRQGVGVSAHIEARAGLGKSRLLDDVGAYLRQRGALVVTVRGRPADREMPFAFAGDLAAALAGRRGASGVAPASAATLVALNPTLSSRYQVRPDDGPVESLLARRVHALCDLIQAIADEQPLVLCIDDVHWIDAGSRQLVESIVSRMREMCVLVCLASRPDGGPTIATTMSSTLSPLSASQVHELVLSIATLPDVPWSMSLLEMLAASSGGSPLLVVETLRLALDRGVLVINGNEWSCTDEEALSNLLAAGEAIRERIRPLATNVVAVLAMLAMYGAPMHIVRIQRTLAHVGSSADSADALTTLRELERLGLVLVNREEWQIAHDEIGRIVLETVDAQRQMKLSGALAAILDADAAQDVVAERRAVHFLLASNDNVALYRAFQRMIERRRQIGDRRSHVVLAREWLGEHASSQLVAQLVARLPRLWRAGLWSARRQSVAVALLGVIGLGSCYEWRARTEQLRSMPRLVFADTSGQAWTTRIDARTWSEDPTPLTPVAERLSTTVPALAFHSATPAISPDGRSIAWNVLSADSTTIDIWLRTPAGTRRLTQRARDDVAVEWLPDGSGLVGLSNQWSPRDIGSYDVAIYDTAAGVARPLTQGPGHEGMPRVSPDGLRIAYQRESEGRPVELCVTNRYALRDTSPACRRVHDVGVFRVVGWLNASEVLVVADSGSTRQLVRVDWDRDVATTMLNGFFTSAQLSADRRWVSARMSTRNMPGLREWVIPVGAPERARQVRAPPALAREGWWEGPMDTTQVVRRLVFVDSLATISLGVRFALRVQATTADGHAVPLLVPVRWRVSDTTVAVIDRAGEIRGLRQGTVTVEARVHDGRTTGSGGFDSPGGGIVATRTIHVEAVAVRPTLSESWDSRWRDRWISFGDPAPQVVRAADGTLALAPGGDGVYHSFVLQRDASSAEGGIGVEMRVSTPVTRPSWQHARATLAAIADTAAFERADMRGPPPDFHGADFGCGAEYPLSWADRRTQKMVVRGGIVAWVDLGALGDTLRTGAWWTLRLQLLPDGRCGVAVNGRVVWVSPEPLDIRRPRRLRLGDESVSTQVLYGQVRMWRGVPPDIDWTR